MNKQKQNKQNNRETSNTETGTSIKTTINFIKQRHPVNYILFVVNITVTKWSFYYFCLWVSKLIQIGLRIGTRKYLKTKWQGVS